MIAFYRISDEFFTTIFVVTLIASGFVWVKKFFGCSLIEETKRTVISNAASTLASLKDIFRSHQFDRQEAHKNILSEH